MILLIIFIIVILIATLYKEYNLLPVIPSCEVSDMKIGVLLTMYIGGDSARRDMYYQNTIKWLTKTNLNIFTVDSSGEILNIQHPRLLSHSFIQTKTEGKTASELERDSILKAELAFDFSSYDMIFKITGKYFIPNFESMIGSIPVDSDLIVQNQHSFKHQNSEVVGTKPMYLVQIISKINNKTIFEQVLKDAIKTYKTYRLRPLIIDKKVKRGDGSVLKYL